MGRHFDHRRFDGWLWCRRGLGLGGRDCGGQENDHERETRPRDSERPVTRVSEHFFHHHSIAPLYALRQVFF